MTFLQNAVLNLTCGINKLLFVTVVFAIISSKTLKTTFIKIQLYTDESIHQNFLYNYV